jgi:transposase-like protein
MIKERNAPHTLSEAIRYFADADAAFEFVVHLRWPNGVVCPHCDATDPSLIRTRRIWKCRACKKQFSVKVGTIFEDSPLGLDKWLPALWMIANAKNGISSYEVHRALGVTQKTAWFMLHRIRLAMRSMSFERFEGDVEVDETYVGGLAKFMHRSRRKRMITGRGAGKDGGDKTAVLGMLERKKGGKASRVRAAVMRSTRKGPMQAHIRETINTGATLNTDQHWSYRGMEPDYVHSVIDHAIAYVRDNCHTNTLENFWSLLKRSIKGTYVSVDPGHLSRYVDEQVYRFNARKGTDRTRFMDVVRGIVGKRLTYSALIFNGELQTC